MSAGLLALGLGTNRRFLVGTNRRFLVASQGMRRWRQQQPGALSQHCGAVAAGTTEQCESPGIPRGRATPLLRVQPHCCVCKSHFSVCKSHCCVCDPIAVCAVPPCKVCKPHCCVCKPHLYVCKLSLLCV